MRLTIPNFSLPLLARELKELSAQKRTYVVRTVYAIILYGIASWSYVSWLSEFPADSFELLGEGKPFFLKLVRLQFWGIYLVLPLMTCGTITVEKERQTLQLLRLTRLGSWTILFEKLGSRLFAIGTYLMLALPLAAVSYSMGGVDETDVLKSVYMLGVTALQIGCFSLLCSVWFRTSTGAMLGAYLLGTATLLWGSSLLRLVLVAALQLGLHNLPWPGLDEYGREWFEVSIRSNNDYEPLSGPWVFGFRKSPSIRVNQIGSLRIYDFSEEPSVFGHVPLSMRIWMHYFTDQKIVATSLSDAIICSLPILVSAIISLLLSRMLLWRRAESHGFSLVGMALSGLDRLMLLLNRNLVTQGIVVGQGRDDLPVDQPIAWRERRHFMIGRPEHLWRLLILVETILVVWLAWNSFTSPTGLSPKLSLVWCGLWSMACLIVTVVSTSLVSQERSKQTLDVILTTPMRESEIVLQKLAGLRRIILALFIPLATLIAFQWLTIWNVPEPNDIDLQFDTEELTLDRVGSLFVEMDLDFPLDVMDSRFTLFKLAQTASVPLYLTLLGWLGFQFGMRRKNQLQAVLAIVATLCLAWMIPYGLGMCFELLMRHVPEQVDWIPYSCSIACRWLNPIWIAFPDQMASGVFVPTLVGSDVFPKNWLPLLFHFLAIGGMLWLVRRNALKQFSRFVHRAEPSNHNPVPLKFVDEVPLLEFEAATASDLSPQSFIEEYRSSAVEHDAE